MGRRTKDADWLSNWTIVWKWRKVETPSPVDSTDCCLNICKYIGWIDKYLYLSIQPIHLQILRQRCCLIPRCGNKKQIGFCISGRSRKIMVADQVFVTWTRCNLVLTKFKTWRSFRVLVIKRREGRKVKLMIGLAPTMLSGKEMFVWMSKTHLKIVRLDSFWIMEIKLQC